MSESPVVLLRLPEVQRRTGLTRSVVYELARRGEFPRPLKLTERSSAWVESEVQAWIAARVQAGREAA